MNNRTTNRSNILSLLKLHKAPLVHDYGLLRLGVFGSVARNEAVEDSDIDIVVETKAPDLLRMVNLKEELEELLCARVDLIRYHFRMNPLLKKRIDNEAYYV